MRLQIIIIIIANDTNRIYVDKEPNCSYLPTNVNVPLLLVMSGPPESPAHVPLGLEPRAHSVLSFRLSPHVFSHSFSDTTVSLSFFNISEGLDLSTKPQPAMYTLLQTGSSGSF